MKRCAPFITAKATDTAANPEMNLQAEDYTLSHSVNVSLLAS
jgi:hypothetical protein